MTDTERHQYAVIGRIPCDDEDSVLIVEALSELDATVEFQHWIYTERGLDADDAAEIEASIHGEAVYINGVISGRDMRVLTWQY